MELTNKQNKMQTPKDEKLSVINQTDNLTILKNIPVDDLELNEEQLDIISGGGDPFLTPKG